MSCPGPGCGCEPRYSILDDRLVRGELSVYRRNGPDRQSRELVAVLAREGLDGAKTVDIGAGIGGIGHGLVAAGAAEVTDIDGSPAYLAAAREEAERVGTADRWRFLEGDYVARADEIGPVDVVTLGKVLCCYEDWRELVAASTAHARRLYGLVYPVSRWWAHAAALVLNPLARLFMRRFRFFVHPEDEVDAAVRAAGFERIHAHRGLFWQVAAYRRIAG